MSVFKGFTASVIIFLACVTPHAFANNRSLNLDVQISDLHSIKLSWTADRSLRYQGATVLVQKRIADTNFKTIKRLNGAPSGRVRVHLEESTPTDYRITMRRERKTIGQSAVITVYPNEPQENTVTTVISQPEDTNPQDTKPHQEVTVELRSGETLCPAALVQGVLSLIDQHRVRLGLATLLQNDALNTSAAMHSLSMLRSGVMTHDGWFEEILATGYNFTYLAQNVAFGYTDASALVNAWLASPGHRANIESSRARDTGLSCVKDAKGQMWWSHNFGA